MHGNLEPEEHVFGKNFTVYSKEGCPYCVKVQKVLELAGLNHVLLKPPLKKKRKIGLNITLFKRLHTQRCS